MMRAQCIDDSCSLWVAVGEVYNVGRCTSGWHVYTLHGVAYVPHEFFFHYFRVVS